MISHVFIAPGTSRLCYAVDCVRDISFGLNTMSTRHLDIPEAQEGIHKHGRDMWNLREWGRRGKERIIQYVPRSRGAEGAERYERRC